MISLTATTVSVFVMIAVFFSAIAFFAVTNNQKSIGRMKSSWIFDEWQENLYDSLFKKEPQEVAKSIGIDFRKYLHNCKICKEDAKIKKVITERLVGLSLLALSGIVGLVTKNIIIVLLGSIVSLVLSYYGTYKLEQNAKKRKEQIVFELPRFLDLFHTALLIGIPVEQAIDITSDSLKNTILAKDLKRAMTDAKMGVVTWVQALENLAEEYEVDALSDFILDITNAYNNGSPIIDSVIRQNKDIKQTRLLTMKERSAKLTNIILIPIVVFKILPILAIIGIPIVIQLNQSGFTI